MKKYIGTKEINALPMNRQEYNNFRGWKLPDDENGDDEGYLVEYVDGGKANTLRSIMGMLVGLLRMFLKEPTSLLKLRWTDFISNTTSYRINITS